MEVLWNDSERVALQKEAFNKSYRAFVDSAPALAAHKEGFLSVNDPDRWIQATRRPPPRARPPTPLPPHVARLVSYQVQGGAGHGRWLPSKKVSAALGGFVPDPPPGLQPAQWTTALCITALRRHHELWSRLEPAVTPAMDHVDAGVLLRARELLPPIPCSFPLDAALVAAGKWRACEQAAVDMGGSQAFSDDPGGAAPNRARMRALLKPKVVRKPASELKPGERTMEEWEEADLKVATLRLGHAAHDGKPLLQASLPVAAGGQGTGVPARDAELVRRELLHLEGLGREYRAAVRGCEQVLAVGDAVLCRWRRTERWGCAGPVRAWSRATLVKRHEPEMDKANGKTRGLSFDVSFLDGDREREMRVAGDFVRPAVQKVVEGREGGMAGKRALARRWGETADATERAEWRRINGFRREASAREGWDGSAPEPGVGFEAREKEEEARAAAQRRARREEARARAAAAAAAASAKGDSERAGMAAAEQESVRVRRVPLKALRPGDFDVPVGAGTLGATFSWERGVGLVLARFVPDPATGEAGALERGGVVVPDDVLVAVNDVTCAPGDGVDCARAMAMLQERASDGPGAGGGAGTAGKPFTLRFQRADPEEDALAAAAEARPKTFSKLQGLASQMALMQLKMTMAREGIESSDGAERENWVLELAALEEKCAALRERLDLAAHKDGAVADVLEGERRDRMERQVAKAVSLLLAYEGALVRLKSEVLWANAMTAKHADLHQERNHAFDDSTALLRRAWRASLGLVEAVEEWRRLHGGRQILTKGATRPPEFIWGGQNVLLGLCHSLDFLAETGELVEWYSPDTYPWRRNPFCRAISLDERPPTPRSNIKKVVIAGEEQDEVSPALQKLRDADMVVMKEAQLKLLDAAPHWPCYGVTAGETKRIRAAEKVLLAEEHFARVTAAAARARGVAPL